MSSRTVGRARRSASSQPSAQKTIEKSPSTQISARHTLIGGWLIGGEGGEGGAAVWPFDRLPSVLQPSVKRCEYPTNGTSRCSWTANASPSDAKTTIRLRSGIGMPSPRSSSTTPGNSSWSRRGASTRVPSARATSQASSSSELSADDDIMVQTDENRRFDITPRRRPHSTEPSNAAVCACIHRLPAHLHLSHTVLPAQHTQANVWGRCNCVSDVMSLLLVP